MDGCIPQHMKRIRRWIQSDMSKRESKFSILINSKVGIFTCINLFIFHFVSSTTESLRSNHTNDYFLTKAHLRKLGSYKGLKVVQPMSQVSSSGGPMVTCRHTWPLWPGALWSRSAERRREQRVREGPGGVVVTATQYHHRGRAKSCHYHMMDIGPVFYGYWGMHSGATPLLRGNSRKNIFCQKIFNNFFSFQATEIVLTSKWGRIQPEI